MKILIFGATGFIGKELVKLLARNHNLYVISRNREKAKKVLPENANILNWDYNDTNKLTEIIGGMDILINLAGENIASKLWTKKQKQKILNSRIKIGEQISKAITKVDKKPKLLIQGSAIGYYGHFTKEICDESSPKGNGFLANVTEKWEKSTEQITQYGVKRVVIRTGVVLGMNGGMLPKIIKPIKLFIGHNFGKGINWVSWIHIDDEIRAIEFLINKPPTNGIYNLVAPEPIQTKNLNAIIGKRVKKPIWFNIPKILLTLFLGNMARELLLSSQQIVPAKLEKEDFKFQFLNIEEAVIDLLKL